MNSNLKHISLAELADLAEDKTSVPEREKLDAHVSTCSDCSGTLHRLKQIFGLMRSDNSLDAPRDLLTYAVGLFQASKPEPSSLLRKVLAVLSFDSSQLAPAFGTRSAAGESRQLLYTAEENDIDLHITEKDDGWILRGQVLGPCTGGRVEVQGENIFESTDLSESCEFQLPVVPGGDYRIKLYLPDLEVEVPRLELRK